MSEAITSEVTTLKDGSKGTLFYLANAHISQIPVLLLEQVQAMFNEVIEAGDTYPYLDTANTLKELEDVWLRYNFILLVEGETTLEKATKVMGSCSIKPNYPGRCSHVSNGAFLVHTDARGRGLAKILGKAYIYYAPKLGYKSSVFNLVFETNVASWRCWDSLGFKRLGVVPEVAKLKSYDYLVDAYMYGMTFEEDKSDKPSKEVRSEA